MPTRGRKAIRPTVGRLAFRPGGGHEYLLERLDGFRIARTGVARTFQTMRLFAAMTVLENLIVAQHNDLMRASVGSIAGLLGLARYRRAEARAIALARDWLERFELLDYADRPAGELPYGAQRRLEIARAMCTKPALLCLDEPAAGLNARESAALNRLLVDLREEHKDLRKHFVQQFKERLSQELLAVREVTDAYREAQLRMIDRRIVALVERVAALTLQKELSVSEHADMVYKSLEEAKKEGVI